MGYRFEQVDVFTDKRFAGNPLAVFTDASGLSQAQMQLIAREMNLSETTFVVPSTRPDCVARYRIFTPGRELPFAGHPTVGTAYVLVRGGRVPKAATSFAIEAQVGAVEVRLEGSPTDPRALFFCSPEVIFGPKYENRARIAEALGLSEADLLPDAPLEQAGCPVFHLNVGVATPQLVDSVVLNNALIEKLVGGDCDGVYVFAPTTEANHFYARLLCFGSVGVLEDPATGSAASPLGAYLVRYGLIRGANDIEILIEQGVKMGRQSFITARIHGDGPTPPHIEVGGGVVSVLTGELSL